jgi:hypothetical protein
MFVQLRVQNTCVLTNISGDGLIRWVFWFRQQRAPGNKITNYEEGIKKISPFSSVSLHYLLDLKTASFVETDPTGRIILVHLDTSTPTIHSCPDD